MYLSKFHIRGYRSIKDLELNFNKGVNIIIGENNSGKTAIIDALRLCLSYGSQFRDIYLDKDRDFYMDKVSPAEDATEIRFDLIFEKDNDFETAVFTDFVSQEPVLKEKQTIQLHFRYYCEVRNEKKLLRWSVWGGDNEGQSLPAEALQLLSFTYLSPLRDAVEKLRPNARGNKIAELYKNLKRFSSEGIDNEVESTVLDKEKKTGLAQKLQEKVNDEEWSALVKTGEGKVLEHIKGASIISKEPNVSFGFLPYTYEGIVNNIEAKTPILNRTEKFDISQNGLGENNIIYAATVLGDLVSNNDEKDFAKRDYYYQALLIEEPEAHLHPQKQNTFFKYLDTFDEKGIQLFITSHSPTITAKANLDYLIVLQKQKNKICAFNISNSELGPENIRYLEKFLDVTKSQLFFSNGTILVEGISEALLLHAFAKKMSMDSGMPDKYDLDKNGIEIVNVGGVAFDHFAKLYNSENAEKRLGTKCSLISDDDRGLINRKSFINGEINEEKSDQIFKALKKLGAIDKLNRIQKIDVDELVGFDAERVEIRRILKEKIIEFSDRAKNALKLKAEDGNLDVQLGERTFEYELITADTYNMRLMKSIYSKMHPLTAFLDFTASIEEQATEILEKLKYNKDKADFAMNLSCALKEKDHLLKRFVVPEYIKKAIKWVIPE